MVQMTNVTAFSFFLIMISVTSISFQLMGFKHLFMNYDSGSRVFHLSFRLLVSASLLAVLSLSAALSPNDFVAKILYTLSTFFYSALVYNFYIFVDYYTRGKSKFSISAKVVGVLLSADAVSILCNLFFDHILVVERRTIQGRWYYSYNPGIIHTVHWTICFLAIIVAVLKLFVTMYRVPYSYRAKYYRVAYSVVAVLVLNMIFHGFDVGIDFSPFFVPFAAVFSYYFAFAFAPKSFVRRSREKVIESLNAGIIIMDFNGEYVDYNKAAMTMLDFDDSNAKEKIDAWVQRNNIDVSTEYRRTFKDEALKDTPCVSVECSQYYEDKSPDILTGTYIKIIDVTEAYMHQEKLSYIASHDGLTDLLNRGGFYNSLDQFLMENSEGDYYIVCTDIQNFKLFNDLFGEEKGDAYLKNLAEGLNNNVKNIKTMGRISGDIIGFLIEKKDFSEEDIRASLRYAIGETGVENYTVFVYTGIYEISDRSISVAAMCDRAIMAAVSIKGKNDRFIEFYDDAFIEELHKERELIDELRRAIRNDEFIFFVQPQITPTGSVIGGEALVRWEHPERGILSPFFFVEVMEKNGMITDLDLAVWRKVCHQLSIWKKQGINDMHLSVNISSKDFYYLDIYTTFTELVKEYDIEPRSLKLEITESAVMQNPTEQIELIKKLQKAGFTVEMDDFGSGYSSLNMLNKISIDVLKLDMGFLSEGMDRKRSRSILKFTQKLARELGISTVVEGVETLEQADFLISIGCDVFQGYLFSRPIPVEEFENKYMNIAG